MGIMGMSFTVMSPALHLPNLVRSKISDENNADFANMPSDQPKSGCFNCGEDG